MVSLRTLALILILVGTILTLVSPVVPAAAQGQKLAPEAGAGPDSALPGPNATTPQADQNASRADSKVQPVPGAWPGSTTVPSTMSERNAARDKLSIAAYTFGTLTPAEHIAIFDGLSSSSASQRITAQIGTELPSSVKLQPLPDSVVSKVPRIKGYDYVAAKDKVYLVQAPTRFVVAVIDQPAAGAASPAR